MLDLIRAFNAWASDSFDILGDFFIFVMLLFAIALFCVLSLALLVAFLVVVCSSVYSWGYRKFHLSEHPDRWSVCFYDGYGNVIHELVPEDVVPEEYAKEWLFQHRSWKKDSCAVLYRMYRETTVKRGGDRK